jgi:hypothetical protein
VSSKEASVLDLNAVVDVDGNEDLISFRDLLRWLHEGRRWVTLADGSVAKLDPQILQPIAEAAGAIEFDKAGHAELSTLELGTLGRLLGAAPTAEVAKEVRKLMEHMTGDKSAKAPKKAKALTAKLREYQRSGFAWLWQLHENADDRHPRRRHGPRQDGPGAGAADEGEGGGGRRAVADRVPDLGAVGVETRGQKVGADACR